MSFLKTLYPNCISIFVFNGNWEIPRIEKNLIRYSFSMYSGGIVKYFVDILFNRNTLQIYAQYHSFVEATYRIVDADASTKILNINE